LLLPQRQRFCSSCELPQTISTHAQYVALQQYCPRLVIYLFPTPPIKLKVGLQKVGDY
jgi:hypothetical protein